MKNVGLTERTGENARIVVEEQLAKRTATLAAPLLASVPSSPRPGRSMFRRNGLGAPRRRSRCASRAAIPEKRPERPAMTFKARGQDRFGPGT